MMHIRVNRKLSGYIFVSVTICLIYIRSVVYQVKQPVIFGPEKYGNYTVQMQPNLDKLIDWTNPRYPYNVTYLIENPDLCSSVKDLSVLVVVNSGTEHFDRRLAIRRTWTNNKYYSHLGTVRVLFLLGMTANPVVQEGIEEEAEAFRDILQGDFIDTYLNLTHKGVMGFKWITERCRNAKMIMKVDDDFVINMFLYFKKLDGELKSINVYCEMLMQAVIQRNITKRWYVSPKHFKGELYYERYCEGKFVSMTNDIIPSLYKSAMRTPFFPYDDVLLFGYVMHNIPGLRYRTDSIGMTLYNDIGINCLHKQKSDCEKFVIVANSAIQMERTWLTILKYYVK
ncbi:beta-1,3-galactosyltransferase 1-like [Ruditapes philippinarum]|uniref:beta-1,3-galactosyltransferase 1-like n=1 Tax=Ruditapes philippinarum TaxID=129788 RepID=UPI00295BE44E|nr:beta-1,3-galactosyltransferase 1-like [Ruditapes philippinarum]